MVWSEDHTYTENSESMSHACQDWSYWLLIIVFLFDPPNLFLKWTRDSWDWGDSLTEPSYLAHTQRGGSSSDFTLVLRRVYIRESPMRIYMCLCISRNATWTLNVIRDGEQKNAFDYQDASSNMTCKYCLSYGYIICCPYFVIRDPVGSSPLTCAHAPAKCTKNIPRSHPRLWSSKQEISFGKAFNLLKKWDT